MAILFLKWHFDNYIGEKVVQKITFLGPVGATFSHDAYSVFAEMYDIQTVTETDSHICFGPFEVLSK